MTIDEAIESMRLAVNEPADVQCQQMRVLADVYREGEAMVTCEACGGCGWVDQDDDREIERGRHSMSCHACNGAGVVSNGNAARGDALELLGECGKCGQRSSGYVHEVDRHIPEANVPQSWYDAAIAPLSQTDQFFNEVSNRLALMDAYAAASPETRERWAADTRALAEGVT